MGEASKLKSEELELTPEALRAFEDLKKKCMTAPVLVFADFWKPFWLETDASGEGLGAILLQALPPGGLCQLRTKGRRAQVSFLQARVLGPQMGRDRAVSGIPPVPALHSMDG